MVCCVYEVQHFKNVELLLEKPKKKTFFFIITMLWCYIILLLYSHHHHHHELQYGYGITTVGILAALAFDALHAASVMSK